MTVRYSKSDIEIYLEDNAGFCTNCKEVTEESGIEPDAEEYQCGCCDGPYLEGFENALICGHVETDESVGEVWD
jgi:hypothetical protein